MRIDRLFGSVIQKVVYTWSRWLWMRTWAQRLEQNVCGNRRVAFSFIRCHIPAHHWPIWICHCCRSPLKWLKFEKVNELKGELAIYIFTHTYQSNSIFIADFPSIIDLHRRFVALCRNGTFNINVFSFIEMELTQLSVLYLRIIDVISGGTLHMSSSREQENQSFWWWIKWIRRYYLQIPVLAKCAVCR